MLLLNKASSTAEIKSALCNIPILTALAFMSDRQQLICFTTNSIGISNISKTPFVFCSVNAVIAVIPYTPKLVSVFKSACIPAPPLGSDPAMTKTVFCKLFNFVKFIFFKNSVGYHLSNFLNFISISTLNHYSN